MDHSVAPSPSGPVFSDAIGADLLTATARQDWRLKERYDSLTFLNHAYLEHTVRLTLTLSGVQDLTRDSDSNLRGLNTWRRETILTADGMVVVPIAALDRRARATPQIVNEAGNAVHVLTPYEVDELFGGGLVAYAARILGPAAITGGLEDTLRRLPLQANIWPDEPDATSASQGSITDLPFVAKAENELLEHGQHGVKLLISTEFQQVLRVAIGANPLVVLLNPAGGPRRILSYKLERPLIMERRRALHRERLRSRAWRGARRFVTRSGTINVQIPLGVIRGCDRYVLEAEAPFDAWFHSAQVVEHPSLHPRSEPVDTSQYYRLSHVSTRLPDHAQTSGPFAAMLHANLRALPTGVVRISALASLLTAAATTMGLLYVIFRGADHELLPSDVGSGAAVLLLFPGVAAASLNTPAPHTLTVTLQFPLRVLLWCLSILSFIVALAAAMRLNGGWNIALWALVTLAAWLITAIARWRVRDLRTSPSRSEIGPADTVKPLEAT